RFRAYAVRVFRMGTDLYISAPGGNAGLVESIVYERTSHSQRDLSLRHIGLVRGDGDSDLRPIDERERLAHVRHQLPFARPIGRVPALHRASPQCPVHVTDDQVDGLEALANLRSVDLVLHALTFRTRA